MQFSVESEREREVIDITESVETALGKQSGVCVLSLAHTTAALTTMDLDPGTDLDFLDFLKALVPTKEWRHPHDPSHTPDHLLSALIGTSTALVIKSGKLMLGTWQRLVLVELNGPRQRVINISILEGK